MKTVEHIAAQGDVLFRRVDALPAHATQEPRNGPLIVAHSETGHHHVVHSPDVALYRSADPLVCFLRLECAFADVEHLRPFDTHETLRLLGGVGVSTYFEVRRQREQVPEAWRERNGRRWQHARD